MLKKINALIIFLLLYGTADLFAQFPYTETFKKSIAPDIVFGGAPNPAVLTSGIDGDAVNEGYLRLTKNLNDQTGFIHNNTSFPSKTGLVISFEFFIYGGQADGITFFLYDASAPTFNIGGFGGSLGYAQYKEPNTNTVYPGVSGGYLGIGIDEYGNFSNPIENRQGGPGFSPNTIALRGKGNGSSTDASNYTYLTGKKTYPDLNFVLNADKRRPDPSEEGYRKAIIILEPKALGYFITVNIITGGTTPTTHTVINKYAYNEPAPTLVRYGLGSSTGFYTNTHEIRNLTINTFEPFARDDAEETSRNTPRLIKILDNDVVGIDPFDRANIVISNLTPGASVTKNNTTGEITYTPPLNFVGKDTFKYIIYDTGGRPSNQATVEVDVKINSIKPRGSADNAKTLVNTPVTIPVLNNDDPTNGPVSVSIVPGSSLNGTPVVNGNGTVTFTPTTGFIGTATFQYTLKNIDDLVSDPITVTVLVNSPPVAVADIAITSVSQPVDIDVTLNDTDADGIKKSTVAVTNPTPQHLVTTHPTTGVVTYTPPANFAGKYVFFYTVKDQQDEVSNQTTVTVSVKPVGSTDERVTLLNTPITVNILNNDLSKTGVTVVSISPTSKGVVVVNPDNSIIYTPNTGSVGIETFTYKLRTTDGVDSDPITVKIIINQPPVAVNDTRTTEIGEQVVIDILTNDQDTDGSLNKSSIIITPTNLQGGTLSTPDAQGNVTYLPKAGFVGVASFTYTVKDNDGALSNVATVTITITSVPKIGLSKELVSVKNSINGTFIVRFKFHVGNYGIEPLEKVSVKDNLAATFPGVQVNVISVNPTGTLKANANYNGIGDTELLDQSSTLAPNSTATVELILNIILLANDGTYQNTGIAEGYSNGLKTTDESVSGAKPDPFIEGDVTPSSPTFFQLKKGPLYIPEGFSPNGDGTNDFFVISNSQGLGINLEVFNRWGNRVYRSSVYKNDWDGKCTEGIFLGQDLPVGTYYYIAVIDGKDKVMGFLTINR